MTEKKKTNTDIAIAELTKNYGEGTVMKLTSKGIKTNVLSSGILSLDNILGAGGYPYGRIIEIYGPESAGKSTLTLHALAEAQKAGLECAFIDMEHAFDTAYASTLGVDISKLLFSQPSTGEEALNIAWKLISTGNVKFIVIDSVAGLIPASEQERDVGQSAIGTQGKLMSQALRKLTPIVGENKAILIFTNQLREKVGVIYGSPEVTSGGNALKFYASIRLDIRRIDKIKGIGEEIIGNKTRIKTVKNKIAPPFKQTEVNIMYGKGIDVVADILQLCIANELIKKSGSWYSYGDTKLGQGEQSVVAMLRDNEELIKELRDKL